MLFSSQNHTSRGFEVLDALGWTNAGTAKTKEEALLKLSKAMAQRGKAANGLLNVVYWPAGFRGRKFAASGMAVQLTRERFYYHSVDSIPYFDQAKGMAVRVHLTNGCYAEVMLYGKSAEYTLDGVSVRALRMPWRFQSSNIKMLVSPVSEADLRLALSSPLIFPLQHLARSASLQPGMSVGFTPDYSSTYATGTIAHVEVRRKTPPVRQRESFLKRVFS